LSSPILTRLYAPNEFGAVAVYAAFLAFISLVASGRFELAIPLPVADGEAANVVALSLSVLLLVVAATGALVLFFGDGLMAITNTPVLAPFLWALPIGVLLGGSNKVLTYWALRKKGFRCIAGTRVQQGGGMAASQVALGFAGWGALGLIVGQIVGYTAGFRRLLQFAVRSGWDSFHEIRPRLVLRAASRFRRFLLFSTWSDMANVGGTQLPLVLFARLFSPTVAGFYLLANQVANAPAVLFAEAIGKALLASGVDARREGTLGDLALDAFRLLMRMGVPPLVVIGAFAPEVFRLIFGTTWVPAGRYLQLILPWLAAVFVFAPLTNLYAVLERQRADFLFQMTLLVTRISGLLVGAALGGPVMAIALYSASACAVYTGFGSWLLRMAGVAPRKIGRVALEELLLWGLVGLTLLFVKSRLLSAPVSLLDPGTILTFAIALASGFGAAWRVRPALASMAGSSTGVT
jgi:O-antigen/teichoic acid export membrane protein